MEHDLPEAVIPVLTQAQQSPTPDQILRDLKRMSDIACDAVSRATQAFFTTDGALATSVIENDRALNSFEIDVDAGIVKIFAFGSPTPGQLRFLLAAQTVCAHLERIGDHAVNIAEATLEFHGSEGNEFLGVLPDMSSAALTMLGDSIIAFFDKDREKADLVLLADDALDNMNHAMSLHVKNIVLNQFESFEAGMEILRVSRNLERIGDLATNIAEESIFLITSHIVKHHDDRDTSVVS